MKEIESNQSQSGKNNLNTYLEAKTETSNLTASQISIKLPENKES
jgi:hypothetical protein